MKKDEISMKIVNPHAAGIDVGSRSHWVSAGSKGKDIKEFGVYNEDLFAMADWFEEKGVKTIAMESTGTYWQSLYSVLISRGFEVFLVNGKYTKNIQGKKTANGSNNTIHWAYCQTAFFLMAKQNNCVLIAAIGQT